MLLISPLMPVPQKLQIKKFTLITVKLTVRATAIAVELQISFCQDESERPYVYRQNIVFKFGEMSCLNQH